MSEILDWEALLAQAPEVTDEEIHGFIGEPLDEDAMTRAVAAAAVGMAERRKALELETGMIEDPVTRELTPADEDSYITFERATDPAKADSRSIPLPGGKWASREQIDKMLVESGSDELTQTQWDQLCEHADRRRGSERADENEASDFNRDVRRQLKKLKVTEAAREQLSSEKASEDWKPPVGVHIDAFLAVEPEAPSFHIHGLWPHGGMALLTAPKKWGKSTAVRHAVECVLTGNPFLAQFAVDSPLSRALVIDNELSHRQAYDQWNGTPLTGDQMTLWRLRESLSSLAIRERWVRKELVTRIRDTGAELLVIDPLGPLLRANEWDENSNTDVGRCLDLVAEMADEAGITALLIPHHTGHTGSNARGASVMGDKADAIWSGTLKRPTDPYGPREFGAIGRSGVSQKPVELSWDDDARQPYVTESDLNSVDLSDAEKEGAKAFVVARAVADAVAAGATSKTKVREYVRSAGVKAGNDLIDDAFREAKP